MKGSLLATSIAYGLYVLAWAYIWYMRAAVSPVALSPLQYFIFPAINGLGAFPLYLIAEKKFGGIWGALLALAYLLYFPLAGIDWSGSLAIFVVLFLFGYYLYTLNSKYSVILFALASVTGWAFALVSLVFSAYLTFRSGKRNIAYFAVSAASLGLYSYLGFLPSFGLNIAGGLLALFLALVPLLFTSLFDSYALMLIPLAALALLSPSYQFPAIFTSGSLSAFIPFIFISSSNSIGRITRWDSGRIKVALILALINVGMFAAVYQPYSPLNQYSSMNYGLDQIVSNYSQTRALYSQFSNMLKLLPKGSEVVVQEDLPFSISGITVYTVKNAPQNPQWVLVGPYNQHFTSCMAAFAERLYDTGNYGIYAEAYGMVLMERNYTGPMVYYDPTNISVPASELHPLGASLIVNGELELSDVSNSQGWYGPYTFLPPGNYTLVIYMKQSTQLSSNSLSIGIYADNLSYPIVPSFVIGGSSVGTSWTREQINFTVGSLYQNVEVYSYIHSWNGVLYVSNESIVQGLKPFKAAC